MKAKYYFPDDGETASDAVFFGNYPPDIDYGDRMYLAQQAAEHYEDNSDLPGTHSWPIDFAILFDGKKTRHSVDMTLMPEFTAAKPDHE